MTTFKEPSLQKIYTICRRLAADTSSEFYVQGRPRRGAGHRNAYWTGREGKANRLWSRGTLAYACWAAGRDDFRAAARKAR